ncbi:hypothetical protein GCM10023322_34160 [Rugosimonospora acidiphila]|uniref:Uncharacterized protein n=1 Tax=Rugosimonospora acidiphila TaxID=556531 RepID=A0ABP9RTK2_9ACTN
MCDLVPDAVTGAGDDGDPVGACSGVHIRSTKEGATRWRMPSGDATTVEGQGSMSGGLGAGAAEAARCPGGRPATGPVRVRPDREAAGNDRPGRVDIRRRGRGRMTPAHLSCVQSTGSATGTQALKFNNYKDFMPHP